MHPQGYCRHLLPLHLGLDLLPSLFLILILLHRDLEFQQVGALQETLQDTTRGATGTGGTTGIIPDANCGVPPSLFSPLFSLLKRIISVICSALAASFLFFDFFSLIVDR